ncbi:unnamed protein product [Closterium sp. NIES-53]
MSIFAKIKAVDFYRRIPRDLTEASLSGATLSLVAATWIIVLVWLELRVFLTVTTSTTVIVDQSPNTDLLRINFNFSFPALSCEFASVDITDVIGTVRYNLSRTLRKHPIDSQSRRTHLCIRAALSSIFSSLPLQHTITTTPPYPPVTSPILAIPHLPTPPSSPFSPSPSSVSTLPCLPFLPSPLPTHPSPPLQFSESLVAAAQARAAAAAAAAAGGATLPGGDPAAEASDPNRRRAPQAAGCQIEGFVLVKKVRELVVRRLKKN